MNLTFETNFTVLPKHCNYHIPMIFGGEFFAQMDLAAAMCVSRLLHDSECDSAVTHKFSGEFLAAAEMGDIIFLKCEVTELRKKAVVVSVVANREKRTEPGQDLIAKAEFVFVTKKNGIFAHHNLKGIQNG
jgi:acyl-CoA hydrolase